MKIKILGALTAVVVLSAAPRAAAQDAAQDAAPEAPRTLPDSARVAYRECVAAVREKRDADARTSATRAAALYRRWMEGAASEAEPRVGLAGVRARCELPYADMVAKGALIGQANTLLEEALRLDPRHWEARYFLAMNYYNSPPMMGKGDEAIRHLEVLVQQQGDTARSSFALPHLSLGDAYKRKGETARAEAVWRRALEIFPNDARFYGRLGIAPPPEGGAPAGGPRAAGQQPTKTVALEAIVVQGGSRMNDTQRGTNLRRVDVVTTPGGTADLMQAFQTQPGTTRAGEGSDLYVRGGDPAEAPVFVNGGRLIYPGRYENLNGGAIGILDSNVLKGAYFSSGGFSARYGNALSGVLDVQTVGRPAVRMGRLNVNTVQAGGVVDLPLGPSAGVWATARASDARLMLAMHGRGGEFASAPTAREAMVGAAWEPRANTELRLIALADADDATRTTEAYGWTGPFRGRGANQMVTLSGRSLVANERLKVSGSLSASRREGAFTFGVLDRSRTDRSVHGRLDVDAAVTGGQLRAGAEWAWMDAATYGTVPTGEQLAPGSAFERIAGTTEDARHLGAYVEHERQLGGDFALIAGVRADRLPGEAGWTLDPRLALARRTGDWTLRVGGGLFHQGRWRTRFQVPNAGTPSGIPLSAVHLVAGVERDGEPSLRVEGYLKQYGDYAPDGPGPRIEAGRVAGMDAIVRWARQKRVNGWITYSFLDGTVRLEDGGVVPSAVDVTHSLTGVARVTLAPQWELGSTARLGTGRPYTPVLGSETDPASGRPVPVYGEVHGERLPLYARLDARLTRFVPMRAGMGVVYAEVLNLLDRSNVAGYTYDAGYQARRPIDSFYATLTAVFGMGITF